MSVMSDRRPLLLAILGILLTGWVAWQIYAGWGLVTLDEKNAPLARVLGSIARQGGIEIATNMDPSTPVTIKVKRVPPVEALDIVAVRTDANWRLAYLGAPGKSDIDQSLAAFRSGTPVENWSSFGSGGFSLVQPPSGAALDLRRVRWEPSGAGSLADLMREAANKTGVLLAAPDDWNPNISAPSAGKISRAAPDLFRQAGGTAREIFLLRGRPPGEDEETRGERRGGGWIGAGEGNGGGWGGMLADPDSIVQRSEAQIALLPASEQEQARNDLDLFKKLSGELASLPEDQRRARAREFFNRPEIAERMDERRMAREAKMTREQRIERAQRYLQRKAAMKKAAQSSSP